MFNKKSIVLNGVSDNSQKGILSIEQDGDNVYGNIRLFNFNSEPNGIISLGIYNDDKVIKAGLTRLSDMFFGFKSELKKIPQNFSCAVVNFVGGEPRPLLYGNSDGYFDKDRVFDEVISKLKSTKSTSQIEEILDKYDINYTDEENKQIDSEIEQNITQDDIAMCQSGCEKQCEKCEYKKYYISHAVSLDETTKTIDEGENDIEKTKNFYEEMKEHIDKLFSNNPSENYLQSLLPNSKFVRVDLDENNYYVLGLIYSDNIVKYICYGVPGIYQKDPPRQLSGYPVWFPIDQEKPQGFGYWLTYQDADSGESVKALIV